MSSCMNSSSSIRASFFASAVRESARRTSSIERRDFFPPPDAVWHCQNEERERQTEDSTKEDEDASLMNGLAGRVFRYSPGN